MIIFECTLLGMYVCICSGFHLGIPNCCRCPLHGAVYRSERTKNLTLRSGLITFQVLLRLLIYNSQLAQELSNFRQRCVCVRALTPHTRLHHLITSLSFYISIRSLIRSLTTEPAIPVTLPTPIASSTNLHL